MDAGVNFYADVRNNPANAVDPYGLKDCPVSSCMQNCLEQVFGQPIPNVRVMTNTKVSWTIGLTGSAVSHPNSIKLPRNTDCDEFFNNLWLVLHEYFHVVRQHRASGPAHFSVGSYIFHHGKWEEPPNNFAVPEVGPEMRQRTQRGMLLAVLVAVGISALACDTMISDRMVIRAPTTAGRQGEPDEVLTLVRETLVAADLEKMGESRGVETWRWKGDKPPGLTVTVKRVGDEVQVRLAQDLYGPTGPTDKYKTLKATLHQAVRGRFGKDNVHE